MAGVGDAGDAPFSLSRLLFAAFAGTAALTAFERLEWRILGRKPLYAPERIARRLFSNGKLGPLLRFTYGPTVGAVLGLAGAPPLVFAVALALAELWFLPRSGATVPLRRWPASETAALFVHTAAFSLATSAVLRQLPRSASRKALAV